MVDMVLKVCMSGCRDYTHTRMHTRKAHSHTQTHSHVHAHTSTHTHKTLINKKWGNVFVITQ